MASNLLSRAAERGFTGSSSAEIVERGKSEYAQLSEAYKSVTSKVFDPHTDENVGRCYAYLYQRNGYEEKPWGLDEVKRMVNKSEVNSGRLVYATWLNTLMTVFEGTLDHESADAILNAMRKKGDEVLHSTSGSSIPELKKEFMTERAPVTAEVAISLGTIQMLDVLKEEKVFEDHPEKYDEMFRAAIVKG